MVVLVCVCVRACASMSTCLCVHVYVFCYKKPDVIFSTLILYNLTKKEKKWIYEILLKGKMNDLTDTALTIET